MRILLVEDNVDLARRLAAHIGKQGFVVDVCGTAADAIATGRAVDYDVALYDPGLPDSDGFDRLKELRAGQKNLPVIIISARDMVRDPLAGFSAGVDDYLVKPFDMDELVARIRAVSRRLSSDTDMVVNCANLSFDTNSRTAAIDGRPILMRRRETALLEMLLHRKGQVLDVNEMREKLYGFDEEIGSNSIEVHLHHLRRRLRDAGAKVTIVTIRGLGYLLKESPP